MFGATCCLLVWAVNIFPRLVSLDKQKMFSLLLRKLQMFCQHIFLNHLQLHFNHHHRLHFLPFALSSALSSVTVAAAILTNLSNLASQASLLRPLFHCFAPLLFQLNFGLPCLPLLCSTSSSVCSPRMHMKHVDFSDSNNKSRNQILFPMSLNICLNVFFSHCAGIAPS